MKLKHIFISVLDINELLPFAVKKAKSLQESMKAQENSKKELNSFISKLEKNLKEEICYIGMDVIGEKSYERFMLGSGFFEIMIEAPMAMNAHFPDRKKADRFCKALKKTLDEMLPEGSAKAIFLESIEVQDEHDTSLTVEDWHKIREIREK